MIERTYFMTQYLILIYGDESAYARGTSDDWKAMTLAHKDFQAANGSNILGGNALETIGTATSIRTDTAGTATVTDGPFVETKEALGGYYLIEAADLDEAVAIAKQVPATYGGVEVRPIMDIP
jgi:hypothetical protein